MSSCESKIKAAQAQIQDIDNVLDAMVRTAIVKHLIDADVKTAFTVYSDNMKNLKFLNHLISSLRLYAQSLEYVINFNDTDILNQYQAKCRDYIINIGDGVEEWVEKRVVDAPKKEQRHVLVLRSWLDYSAKVLGMSWPAIFEHISVLPECPILSRGSCYICISAKALADALQQSPAFHKGIADIKACAREALAQINKKGQLQLMARPATNSSLEDSISKSMISDCADIIDKEPIDIREEKNRLLEQKQELLDLIEIEKEKLNKMEMENAYHNNP